MLLTDSSVTLLPAGHKDKLKAFTLIELLVVIAIIAILAAMLLPALSAAKRKSQDTADKNNLKQMALAGFMYQNDFGPFAYDPSGNNQWIEVLLAYQGNVAKIRSCPLAGSNNIPSAVDNGVLQWFGTANYDWGNNYTNFGSYTINGWLLLNNANSLNIVGTETLVGQGGLFNKPENIMHPSQTPMFCDGNWPDAWPDSGTAGALGDIEPGTINLYTGG